MILYSVFLMRNSIVAEKDSALRASSLDALRAFKQIGKASWSGVSDADWNDWRWQLRNRITRLDQLEGRMNLSAQERAGVLLSNQKLAMAITPYFFNLIDVEDLCCPIRRQVIPQLAETKTADWEMSDPVGEDASSPIKGIVHRYPDRILFLLTDRCAAYCRYCTRSRLVSNASGYDFRPKFEEQIEYVRNHSEIRDVLISGGDPFLFSNERLASLLDRLRSIDHVEFLRIGTRIPIFLPQRIDAELCKILKKAHPLFISIHVNHPSELSFEVRESLERLADSGVPLGNQSVLLRKVNDSSEVMKILVQKLLRCRVRPYYLYQCDLISGSSHLRTSVSEGIKIIEELQGHTSGYAIPQFVIDAPGGGGKIPIHPQNIIRHDANQIILRNYEGKTFEYPEIPSPPNV